ncbi:NADH:ubiquinone oxidoreductase [Vibrio cincinnatiensis]|uniref:NADH:ubiquinone oxidoreductase n=1 Tax=Vibrio cincinnatiensis TaxID=675 RepID=UPI001EE0D9B4|nr:NADH:ubiquinone oxidoreductase [Vibrio cincinnatiensis]MCG3728690.1 NADH:ubiquinone oxidoreductase [Vibrio cincinnatiensis]
MKWLLIAIVSVSAAIASAEHFHSFFLGFSIAVLAVSGCYWFAFRSTRFPELALMLLFLGLLVKMIITIIGVLWGISSQLMTSPAIFGLSYLFFSIATTYLWFRYRSKHLDTPKVL